MKQGLTRVSAVVLAAGKGTRMFSSRPKVLQEVCGKPILYYTFRALNGLSKTIQKYAKLDGTYVVVGYEAEKVRSAFKDEDVCWVNQKEQRGTGDALVITQSLLQDINGIILVICGDTPLLTSETLTKLIQVHLSCPETVATILTCELTNPAGYGRIIRDEEQRVKGIIEEKESDETQKKIREINSGIYVFNNTVFDALRKIKLHSSSGEYYLTDVISVLYKEGGKIQTYLADNYSECLGVNTARELESANRLMRQRIIDNLTKNGVVIVAPENTYIEEDVTIGKDTIIYPFTVIHSNVVVGERCKVGPFSHLRSGTILEDESEVGNFTETKKTKLGRGSKAKHLSYLGDTIIGDDVNIGAGTITANFDGVSKNQTIIKDGASTGSGTILIAPIKMGRNSKTGAGAVVPKGKNIADNETVVGMPARLLKRSKSKT